MPGVFIGAAGFSKAESNNRTMRLPEVERVALCSARVSPQFDGGVSRRSSPFLDAEREMFSSLNSVIVLLE